MSPKILPPEQLAELDEKISKIRDKDAYNIAQSQNPRYVADRAFRLPFLRSVKFDTNWAAKKIVAYFGIKMDLFGRDRLTREITLDDFDDQATSCLQSGLCTILPLKDTAGRAVICWTVKFRGSFSTDTKVSYIRFIGQSKINDDGLGFTKFIFPFLLSRRQCQVLFYVLSTLVHDEEVVKRGTVLLVFTDGKPDFQTSLRTPKVYWCMPVRQEASHLCHDRDAWVVKATESALKFTAGVFMRVRSRSHYGKLYLFEAPSTNTRYPLIRWCLLHDSFCWRTGSFRLDSGTVLQSDDFWNPGSRPAYSNGWKHQSGTPQSMGRAAEETRIQPTK